MSDRNIKELYDNIQAPVELQNKILSAMNDPEMRKIKKQRMPVKRFILVAAAIMLCLTMLVSATIIAYNIYNGIYMLPGMGLFDGFNENVRAMPRVLEFGDTTIEMAMTYDKDGVNTFTMMLYAEGNINTAIKPDINDYTDLELIFSNGSTINLKYEPRTSGNNSNGEYYFMYYFEYENFPDESEFIITNNKGADTEVMLAPIEAGNMKITDNGIKRIKMIPAAEGSRIFSYNIEVINPSLAENEAKYVFYSMNIMGLAKNFANRIYFKNGSKVDLWNAGSAVYGTPIFALDENTNYKYHIFGELDFEKNFNKGKIDKIIITELNAGLSFSHPDDFDVNPGDNFIQINFPLPMDGDRFDYDTPLEIAKIGEFTLSVDAIEREENNLMIYTSERCVNYSGSEDISNIEIGFADSSTSSGIGTEGAGEKNYITTIQIPKDYSGDTFETYIVSINYRINGYWEIDFE